MNQQEEIQILKWVYLTAAAEYEIIDKLIVQMQWNGILWEVESAKDFLRELAEYQTALSHVLYKVEQRMAETVQEERNADEKTGVSKKMQQRVNSLKYQIHENKQAGIFAWELAKDLIAMEETLIKKIVNHWE
ncbi:MAG: hypothetical protein IJ471_03255 [Eubacterium sp.]|nr:hypothetical protein [Eubacterium sp.]